MLAARCSVRCSWRMLSAACMHRLHRTVGERSSQDNAVHRLHAVEQCKSTVLQDPDGIACLQLLLQELWHSVKPATSCLAPGRTPAGLWWCRFTSLLHARAAVVRAASFLQTQRVLVPSIAACCNHQVCLTGMYDTAADPLWHHLTEPRQQHSVSTCDRQAERSHQHSLRLGRPPAYSTACVLKLLPCTVCPYMPHPEVLAAKADTFCLPHLQPAASNVLLGRAILHTCTPWRHVAAE